MFVNREKNLQIVAISFTLRYSVGGLENLRSLYEFFEFNHIIIIF